MGVTLPERFLAPAGWRTHSFVNDETGHKIHYGSVFPQRDQPPSAVIVCLGGLSEFAEKYFEVAHDMLDRGYAFWFIDWQYQGRSGRLAKFPQRRHSDGFDQDVSDLHKLVADYIKPSAVHPDRGRIPLIMLGHSMGANIGFHFLANHPKYFDAAAFTAPFFGIHNFKWPMRLLAGIISYILPLVGKKYIFKGSDWAETMRKGDGSEIFSSDAVRDALHKHWSMTDAELQVGNVTFGWVVQALKSCRKLRDSDLLKNIGIPVLIGVAGREAIVDNDAIFEIVKKLPKGQMIEIEGANHEILMEQDTYRNAFLTAFDKMVEENKIATVENLKPF
ncbi:MAG TPA: alpha/beta hydrolase [Micavibrio sp.]|nr:alpha/beta hydrolase [Micavibrio sp.]